jgi:hypothetical protein
LFLAEQALRLLFQLALRQCEFGVLAAAAAARLNIQAVVRAAPLLSALTFLLRAERVAVEEATTGLKLAALDLVEILTIPAEPEEAQPAIAIWAEAVLQAILEMGALARTLQTLPKMSGEETALGALAAAATHTRLVEQRQEDPVLCHRELF